jgi:hypothetical protein
MYFPQWRQGFEPRIWTCGICAGQSGTEVGFLRVLRIPLPILIPPTASHIFIIIYHPELVQWVKQWSTYQVDSVSPHPKKLKKKRT